jgi:hypothetical protein
MVNNKNLEKNKLKILTNSNFENKELILSDVDSKRIIQAIFSICFIPQTLFFNNTSEDSNDFDYYPIFGLIQRGQIKTPDQNKTIYSLFAAYNTVILNSYNIPEKLGNVKQSNNKLEMQVISKDSENYDEYRHHNMKLWYNCFQSKNAFTELEYNLKNNTNKIYINRFDVVILDLKSDIEIILGKKLNLINGNTTLTKAIENKGIYIDQIMKEIFSTLKLTSLNNIQIQHINYLNYVKYKTFVIEINNVFKIDEIEKFILRVIEKIQEENTEKDIKNIDEFVRLINLKIPNYATTNDDGEEERITIQSVENQLKAKNTQYFFSMLIEVKNCIANEHSKALFVLKGKESQVNNLNPFIDQKNFQCHDNLIEKFKNNAINQIDFIKTKFVDDLESLLDKEIKKLKYIRKQDVPRYFPEEFSQEGIIWLLQNIKNNANNHQKLYEMQNRLDDVFFKKNNYCRFSNKINNSEIAINKYSNEDKCYSIKDQIYCILSLYLAKQIESHSPNLKNIFNIDETTKINDAIISIKQALDSEQNIESEKDTCNGVKNFNIINDNLLSKLKKILNKINQQLNKITLEENIKYRAIKIDCEELRKSLEREKILKEEKHKNYTQAHKEKFDIEIEIIKIRKKIGWKKDIDNEIQERLIGILDIFSKSETELTKAIYKNDLISNQIKLLEEIISQYERETNLYYKIITHIHNKINNFRNNVKSQVKYKEFEEKILLKIENFIPLIEYCVANILNNEVNLELQQFLMSTNNNSSIKLMHSIMCPSTLYQFVLNTLYDKNLITADEYLAKIDNNLSVSDNISYTSSTSCQSNDSKNPFL